MLHTQRRLFSTLLTAGLVLGAGTTALTPAAIACGGFFCARVPVDQAGERILFVQNGDEVIAHVQVQYQGAAEKFSWVVPTPSQPTLGVGSDALFTQLRNATRPQFNLTLETKGDCPQPVFAPSAGGVADNAGGLEAGKGVTVVERAQVGPYDSVVLQSNDPGALKTWLRENEYDIPAKLDPLLDPYVTGKYYFVALKLLKDRSTGDLQPIVMKYKATKPGVPIRLTGIAATDDMDVYVWVLGKNRAIPENYRHAQINEARIDWMNAGTNYRQVVTEAMNEAGGQAFVTDYAGDSRVVPTDAFSGARFDTAAIAALTDPVALAKAVVAQGYFDATPGNLGFSGGISADGFIPITSQQTVNFLKRHVPKPAAWAQVDDFSFYQNLGRYKADLAAVDGAKAAAELDQTVVQPYKEIRALFAQYPYLTQLYTTMSPSEMTQDPTFLFNPDMPKISNIHTATGVRDCSNTQDFFSAPVRITLSNGVTFLAAGSGSLPTPGNPGEPVAMPAALRIEQLKATGGASLIQDNQQAIAKALGVVESRGEAIAVSTGVGAATGAAGTSTTVAVPRAPRQSAPTTPGFGCACAPANQPAVPLQQGAGEGLSYALAVLGFLGYRRWLGRK